MGAFDDRKIKQKKSTVFMKVVAIHFIKLEGIYSLNYYYHLMIKTKIANLTLVLKAENSTSALFKQFQIFI